ncbi:ankyrin repeat-containing domain protein [Dactylonectria estremocensis]|uniref:Ankyrin repeat-containing domain protein n=1 Tax=Dactylonectria estremocensis TaxID=1079267 RepID=A0A9P9J9H0_9HYPO|nr:ankyrin repeat-containing domain protein [Dactylonectria estremocensis]
MRPARSQPTEAEWLEHKAIIRRLYLVEGMSLKKLVAELGGLGLFVTDAQLEYKLKQWEFRRNIDRAAWIAIDRKIAKRKLEGKESQVIHRGKRLKQSTIDKETNRHRDIFIPYANPPPTPLPSTPTEAQLVVCTPQPLPMEFSWPSTLPWLKFQKTPFFQSVLSNAAKTRNPETDDAQLFEAAHSKSLISSILASDSQLEWANPRPEVSRLAAIIGKSMPESYPEEHLQRAQALIDGSNEEALDECLLIVIYNLSNNLSSLSDNERWNATIDVLREYGLLNLRANLSGRPDITIRGLMDNLFCAVICRLTDPRNDNTNKGEVLGILKWLFVSGQSPDVSVVLPRTLGSTVTPLQAAILCGNVDLMEHLLDAGADTNLTPLHGNPDPPLMLALKMHSLGDLMVARMAKLLLRHGASVNLDQALHLAILRRNMDLAAAITQQGANLRGTLRSENGFLYEESALSTAAAVGQRETQFLLDLLTSQPPIMPISSFVTPDVMISAAAAANNDAITFLYDFSPASVSANHYGITPLHAAARKGHLSTCQLLLELHGPHITNTGQLSPIHLASCGGYKDVVQLFLDNGVDVDTLARIRDTSERMVVVRSRLNVVINCEASHLTPLETLFEHASTPNRRWNAGHLACATTLIQAGARLTGHEVVLAAQNRHPELLSAALAAGGSPNEKDSNGVTALQHALRLLSKQIEGTCSRGADAATLLINEGAVLFGGEVTSAIYLGNWDLVKLLLRHGGSLLDSDENGMTALEAGIMSRNPHGLPDVLEAHPGIYDAGCLCASITTRMHSITEQLLANRPPQAEPSIFEATAIGQAARLGDLSLLRKLLDCLPLSNDALIPIKADNTGILRPNPKKCFWRTGQCIKGSPLALAAMGTGMKACVELLKSGYRADKLTWTIVADGNDMSAVQILVDHNQRLTGEPMHSAPLIHSPLVGPIKFHHKELVLLLLEAGADVNECNQALLAAIKGHLGLAKHLIDLDAEVTAVPAQRYGRTAIEGASEHGRLDMMELLLCHGALDAEDGYHQYTRSVELATCEGHSAAVELLRGYKDWPEELEDVCSDEECMGDASSEDRHHASHSEDGDSDEAEEGDSQPYETTVTYNHVLSETSGIHEHWKESERLTEEGRMLDEMYFRWDGLADTSGHN